LKSSQSSENRKRTVRSEVQLIIEKPVYGGYGLGRLKGKVFLVRYALPGEVIEAEVLKEHRDHSEATATRIIFPSEARREAPCPYYGKCGGCHLQHAEYSEQINLKRSILLETLGRTGGLKNIPEPDVIPSPRELGYRVRVQFKAEGGRVGFFRWGERELVDVEECPVAHPRINSLIPELRKISETIKVPLEFHLTYSPSDEKFLLGIVSPAEIPKPLLENFFKDLPEEVAGIGNFSRIKNSLNLRSWIGQEHIYFRVKNFTYRVSAGSFFQVNHLLWERFIDEVVKGETFKKAIELYCGVGFFSVPLSERGHFLESSDSNPSAINDAEYNAKLNKRDNLLFVKTGAYRHLKSRGGEVIDLLLLDPPRPGLGKGEAELIAKNKPERIIYVSCNPSTLARDLSYLQKAGYRVESVKIIDLFPQTFHIETIVKMSVQE
jgi:23S rRNA (uracil1939-C5)-methyltransferase